MTSLMDKTVEIYPSWANNALMFKTSGSKSFQRHSQALLPNTVFLRRASLQARVCTMRDTMCMGVDSGLHTHSPSDGCPWGLVVHVPRCDPSLGGWSREEAHISPRNRQI